MKTEHRNQTGAAANKDGLGCHRCGKPYTPKALNLKGFPMTNFCETCQMKNILDALELPTPPSMLDQFTKNPTLSESEFRKQLNADEAA